MKHEIKLVREFSTIHADTRIYLYHNDCIIEGFPDTDEGKEQGRKAYADALRRVRENGQVREVLMKEIVEPPSKENES